jgi:hypothetical protein
MVDPSTATFFALAESMLTAPCTFFTTEVFLTSLEEFVSDLLATRLATVLVVELFDALTL